MRFSPCPGSPLIPVFHVVEQGDSICAGLSLENSHRGEFKSEFMIYRIIPENIDLVRTAVADRQVNPAVIVQIPVQDLLRTILQVDGGKRRKLILPGVLTL